MNPKIPYDFCPECGDQELSFDPERNVIFCLTCDWEEDAILMDEILELEEKEDSE